MLIMPTTAAAVAIPPPPAFLCPISLDLMSDPVVSPDSGVSFDRSSIERWISAGNPTCPLTRAPLSLHRLLPNYTLRRLIHAWSSSSQPPDDDAAAAAALSARLESSLAGCESTDMAAARNDSAAAAAADIMQQVGSLASASPKAQRKFAELGTVSLLASLAFDSSCHHRHAHPCEAFAPENRRTELRYPVHDEASATAALAILSSSFLPCLPSSIFPHPARLASLSHLLSCRRSPPASRAATASIIAYLAADAAASDHRPVSPQPSSDPYSVDIDRARATIGSTPHLLSGLVSLIRRRESDLDQHPTPDTIKTAIRALFALSLCSANWAAAIQAGAPAALLEWLSEVDTNSKAVRVERARDMAVATIELLCKSEEGRREVAAHPMAVAQMRRMVAEGGGGGGGRLGECAVGVLLAIARISEAAQLAMVEEGVVPPLLLLQCHGSSSCRAKKNAISLLKLLQIHWSHHPAIAHVSYTLFSGLRYPSAIPPQSRIIHR